MTNATEKVLRISLTHYGPAVLNVDADCITLSDGTKIFFRSLYLELGSADPRLWDSIIYDWLFTLDGARDSISRKG